MNRLRTALFVLAALMPAAQASQPGIQTLKNWKLMDLCAKQAQAASPDFTPEGNAKRDAVLKECLAANNLPPRDLPSPGQ